MGKHDPNGLPLVLFVKSKRFSLFEKEQNILNAAVMLKQGEIGSLGTVYIFRYFLFNSELYHENKNVREAL